MQMRKWVYLFLLLLALITGGGCGGGDGEHDEALLPPGSGDEGNNIASGVPGLVTGSLRENNVDAYGYFDADVVMYSDAEQEISGLLLILLGVPEGGAAEEVLGSVAVKHIQKGEHRYSFRMMGAAYNHEMDFLKTGKYIKPRLVLVPGENYNGEESKMSVSLNTDVFYTAAGELPVIVKDSIEVDIKEPPEHSGFSGANRLARNDRGWWQMEAGKVNGESVIVAYTAELQWRRK